MIEDLFLQMQTLSRWIRKLAQYKYLINNNNCFFLIFSLIDIVLRFIIWFMNLHFIWVWDLFTRNMPVSRF